MQSGQVTRGQPWLILALCLLAGTGYWYWTLRIYAPANTARLVAGGRPIGNNSDLYARWLGARELLLHGRDPYSGDVTREIQTGFYGRPLNPDRAADPIEKESFVYPLYVVFVLAPTTTWSFPVVMEVFRWILLACIALSIPLWGSAMGLRAGLPIILASAVLALSSPPAVMEYFQQNLTALVVLFVAAAAAAIYKKWLMLGGFLLGLATMKPDGTCLMILWFVFWAASSWKDRQRLLWSFNGTLSALIVGAELLSPGWLKRFLSAVKEYPAYGTDPSILQVLLPPLAAKLAAVGLILLLLAICWRQRKAGAGSDGFGWALAWVGTATFMLLPKLAAYNQVLLIPALLFLIGNFRHISPVRRLPRAMTKAAFACLMWQWAAATVLSVCSVFLPLTRLRSAAAIPDYTLLALGPLTLLALVAGLPALWISEPARLFNL